MATHSETRWIIVGEFGAFEGASSKRWWAIAEHVNSISAECRNEKRFSDNRLSELQKATWARCQMNGARAVKATLTWEDAS